MMNMSENKKVFADNLKWYMYINGKDRNDIAQDLGFSYYTVTTWVNGTKYPRIDKIERLAEYFNISKSQLIEGKELAAVDERDVLCKAVNMLVDCFEHGGKLLVCGNGGSSADSAHIVGELVKGFCKKRPLPKALCEKIGTDKLQMGLPAIDLTAQSAVLSAVANDLGGELCYAQQVMAYGRPGDVFIGISTSGNAQNVALAMKTAAALGMKTMAMTGEGGGMIAKTCDLWIFVPEKETYRVQEEHIRFYHQLCLAVENHFFAE